MKNYLYEDMDHAQRLELLRKSAIRREQMTFKRTLSEADITDRKDLFARDAMRIETEKENFKEFKASKAAAIKAMEKNQLDSLDVIANGKVEVFDNVFLIPDTANNQILCVDNFGEIVHTREMKADERQGRLALPEAENEGGEQTGEFVEFEEITPSTGGEPQEPATPENPEPQADAKESPAKRPKRVPAKKVKTTGQQVPTESAGEEKPPTDAEAPIAIGDTVKVIAGDESVGETGKVTEIKVREEYPVRVNFGKDYGWFKKTELEKQ